VIRELEAQHKEARRSLRRNEPQGAGLLYVPLDRDDVEGSSGGGLRQHADSRRDDQQNRDSPD